MRTNGVHPHFSLAKKGGVSDLKQRFSTGGTRTTGGTPDVAKWYAKNKEININYL